MPELRLHVVTGPRIDPASLGALPEGCEATAFVPELDRHLAACDLALVQGGLTTAMELTANRRPFLYLPLIRHFEQQLHVPHRLDRYRSGRRMDLAALDSDDLAAAMVESSTARSMSGRWRSTCDGDLDPSAPESVERDVKAPPSFGAQRLAVRHVPGDPPAGPASPICRNRWSSKCSAWPTEPPPKAPPRARGHGRRW